MNSSACTLMCVPLLLPYSLIATPIVYIYFVVQPTVQQRHAFYLELRAVERPKERLDQFANCKIGGR